MTSNCSLLLVDVVVDVADAVAALSGDVSAPLVALVGCKCESRKPSMTWILPPAFSQTGVVSEMIVMVSGHDLGWRR